MFKKLLANTWLWIILYLFAIPCYALMYHFFLPFQFFHSTAKNEKSYLDIDADDILQGIKSQIISNYKEKTGKTDTIINKLYFNLNEISCSDLKPLDNTFQISLNYNIVSVDTLGIYGHLGKKLTIPYKWILYQPGIENDSCMLYRIIEMDSTKDIFLSIDFLFENPQEERVIDSPHYFFKMTSDLNDRIIQFNNAVNGYPAKTRGNFWRMLYFSSVTITTVGFGDIVPLTNLARILVASEAVLGIILIGLFLNSLALKIRK